MVPPRHQKKSQGHLDARSLDLLVERAQGGDAQAFDDLVRAFYTSLLTTANHLLGNREDAQDVVQDTFVDAHRGLARFRAQGSFEGWLRGILVHKVRDRFRRQGRGPAFLEDVPWEGLAEREEGDALRRQETTRMVRQGIERLPEALRVTLSLRALDGRSYEEIARLTDVTPATSRTRAMKARRLLMRLLEPWWGGRE